MKAIALVLIGIVAASGCKMVLGNSIRGSGKAASRQIAVGSGKTIGEFKRIQSNGSLDLTITRGPQSDILISGDDNLIDLIEVKLEGDTLKVRLDKDFSAEKSPKVSLTMPEFKGLEINGSGMATVLNLKGDDYTFQINGSGEILASGIGAGKIDASINGSGNIDIAGLPAADVSASIAGSGSIKAHANKTLEANIAGSGEVRYKGAAVINKKVTGSGDISPL